MSNNVYSAVSNTNQGSFNNPRQKTWATMQLGIYGWSIALSTNDLEAAKAKAGELLKAGGMYMSIDRVMVVEIVPIDFVMTPSV
jgi:hypothetical protein